MADNRAMARKPAGKSGSTSPVVIIFTIGVVGWGFFAIDRLTSPPVGVVNAHNAAVTGAEQKPEPGKSKSIKKWILEWLQPELEAPQKARARQKGSESLTAQVKLYMYRMDQRGDTHLVPVARKIDQFSGDDPLKKLFSLVIAGPTDREIKQDFLDSFPDKPRIRSVRKKGEIIEIDFEEGFGHGISFEMVQLQIRQLLKTAKALPGIRKLRILINGNVARQLGGDGLTLPETITDI